MVQGASYCAVGMCIIAAATASVSCLEKRDFDNGFDDKFFGSLIKTKDGRSSLSDLINRLQLLLNDTDEHSSTPSVSTSGGSGGTSRSGSTHVAGTHGVLTYLVSRMSSSRPSTSGSASSDTTNQTLPISHDTVFDVAAEQDLKEMVNQDSNQRVATLGVIVCFTFLGTATCIVVMALCSPKFSGVILLSNGRWWCPIITRGNGVERQLLV